MSKIYIVKSSSGSYEDYSCWNEKAFYNKKDAENYAEKLNNERMKKPDFITKQFESDFDDCEGNLPEREPFDFKNKTTEEYYDWIEDNQNKDIQFIVEEMSKKGYKMIKEMYYAYKEWEDNCYSEWNECEIEEIDIE